MITKLRAAKAKAGLSTEKSGAGLAGPELTTPHKVTFHTTSMATPTLQNRLSVTNKPG
jgi:hypothetical protein